MGALYLGEVRTSAGAAGRRRCQCRLNCSLNVPRCSLNVHSMFLDAHSTFSQCSSMFTQCSLNIHPMFTQCSWMFLDVHSMLTQCSSMFPQCALERCGMKEAMSVPAQCSLNVPRCSLDAHAMFTQCSSMFTRCSLNVHSMYLGEVRQEGGNVGAGSRPPPGALLSTFRCRSLPRKPRSDPYSTTTPS
jgi:hypothetical protein